MKSAFKFKPGAGQIIAFFILAVVFASVAGVVFVAINQSQSKNLRAGNDYTATGLKYNGATSCTSTTARVQFNWNRAVMAGWSNKEDFNLSTVSNFSSFIASVDVSGKNTITYDVPRNQVLYARIATLYNGSTWAFSDTRVISNLTCPIVINPRWSLTINPTVLKSPEKTVRISFSPAATSLARLRILKSSSISDVEKESGSVIVGQTYYDWNTTKTGKFYAVMIENTTPSSEIKEFYVHNRCDLNLDKVVDLKDSALLGGNTGTVPPRDAKYDIVGDKAVNAGDQGALAQLVQNPSLGTTKYCF